MEFWGFSFKKTSMESTWLIHIQTIFLGKVLLKPIQALRRRLIHGLLILVATPITPQGKSMDLIIVDAEFMWDISLLTHHILNLPHALLIQQTISLPHRQAQRFHDGVEVSRDGDQTRMTRHCSIHSSYLCSSLSARCRSMRLEDGIPPSPAESNGANLVSAWRCA